MKQNGFPSRYNSDIFLFRKIVRKANVYVNPTDLSTALKPIINVFTENTFKCSFLLIDVFSDTEITASIETLKPS